MYLPTNPKIAIIDDKIDEVSPLFAVFSKAGIPFVYFDGSEDSFPVDRFPSIRLIVLDIDFKGAFDEKTAASICANAVDRIIKNENQLYCIGFWTRHSNITKHIVQNLSTINKEPIGTFDWEKSEILNKSEGDLIVSLSEKIKDGIKDKAFEFLVFWENSVANYTSDYIHYFEQIPLSTGESKNDQILSILSKLACSYVGKEELDNSEKNIHYATKKLNSGFSDFMQYDSFPYSLDLPLKTSLSLTGVALLNSLLFVEEKNKRCQIENGSVIAIEDDELFESLKKDLPDFILLNDEKTKLVGIVLTPACDLANSKTLKKSSDPGCYYHRVLFGLQIVLDDGSISGVNKLLKLNARKREIKDSVKALKEIYHTGNLDSRKSEIDNCFKRLDFDYPILPEKLFVTSPFHFSEENCVVIFNFASFSTKLMRSEEEILYQFKSTFVHDLQSKIAIHVNRLGNDMIGF